MSTSLLAAADAPRATAGGLALLIGSALVVMAVAGLVVLARRKLRQRGQQPTGHVERRLGELVISALEPELREYLERSSSPLHLDSEDRRDALASMVERLAYISLSTESRGSPSLSLNELAAGLALLESRLAKAVEAVEHLQGSSISQDKLVWTVIGVIGAVVGLLAGIVGVVVGIAQLVG